MTTSPVHILDIIMIIRDCNGNYEFDVLILHNINKIKLYDSQNNKKSEIVIPTVPTYEAYHDIPNQI